MSERPVLAVRDVPEHQRYEATLGDDPAMAALLDYELSADRMVLVRTVVQEGFEGQGVGSRLVEAVIDDARQRGLRVVPECPFVVGWLQKHPEQQDVLERPLEPSPLGGS